MDLNDSKINILIVGATGALGSLTTKHCLSKPNLRVNILIRNIEKNKELVHQVEKAGGKVIEADITKPETFRGVTKGMHTVIFTVSYQEEEVILHGQIAMIDDCVANGVQRIIPNEYSENFADFSQEEIDKVPPFANMLKVAKYLETLPIKVLHINATIFIESFYQLLMTNGFEFWGDPNLKHQMTSYEDTAKIIAAAIAQKDRVGNVVYVANEATVTEAAEIYNKVRGTNYQVKNNGSVEELKAKAEMLENKKDPMSVFLRMKVFLCDKRLRFETTNNNEFPEVRGTSIEEVLEQRPDVKLSV